MIIFIINSSADYLIDRLIQKIMTNGDHSHQEQKEKAADLHLKLEL